MANLSERLNCCGMRDVQLNDNWEGPIAALKDVFEQYHYHPILVLSDRTNKDNNRSEKVIALIKKHKLGEVTQTEAVTNPNTLCMIRAYFWVVDKKAFAKFGKKRKWSNKNHGTRYDRFGRIAQMTW